MGAQSGHDTQVSIRQGRKLTSEPTPYGLAILGRRLKSLSEALRWLLVRHPDLGRVCGQVES
jgi:hypothetical protein